ncbi:MAG: FAD-binding domain-containing protein [Chitinophagales bacterium]
MRTPESFPARHQVAVERLASFEVTSYAATRNFIDGNVSYLSPYISRGVLSLPQVRNAILQRNSPAQAAKFIQELAWREYFQRVWQHVGVGVADDVRQEQFPVAHRQMIAAVLQHQTGVQAVDDAISNLYAHGYMHNHLRMYVASLCTNVARAHWLTPAQWMYYHLLDGDAASNHLSWQWVAGTFSSKKYWCSQENINYHTHTAQRHTFLDMPSEQLQHAPIPEILQTTAVIDLSVNLPEARPLSIKKDQPVHLYNAYQLDTTWRHAEAANRILLLEPSHYLSYPVSAPVIAFVVSLATDINGMQIFVGEMEDLQRELIQLGLERPQYFSKEHPAFAHWPGQRDQRDWLFPEVTDYFSSFSAFWKKAQRYAF